MKLLLLTITLFSFFTMKSQHEFITKRKTATANEITQIPDIGTVLSIHRSYKSLQEKVNNTILLFSLFNRLF
jgi:hypothetical protein